VVGSLQFGKYISIKKVKCEFFESYLQHGTYSCTTFRRSLAFGKIFAVCPFVSLGHTAALDQLFDLITYMLLHTS